jgi:hypothetical protein
MVLREYWFERTERGLFFLSLSYAIISGVVVQNFRLGSVAFEL